MRLSRNPAHVSSWQSRNEGEDQYAGAIRTPVHIFSFSGFPEHLDEAAMLVVGVRSRELTIVQAEEIAAVSKNVCFPLLMEKCNVIPFD